MSGVRLWSATSGPFEYGDPGQFLALEELQAGAATGGDVTEVVVGETELANRRGGVAATDHRQAVDLGEGLRDGARPLGEGVHLEDPHGAVPEDRPRARDLAGEPASRLRTDVQAERAVGNRIGRHHLRAVGSALTR